MSSELENTLKSAALAETAQGFCNGRTQELPFPPPHTKTKLSTKKRLR
jgi:hypothetical protein